MADSNIRYLPPSDRARISIKGTEQNNRYLIAYFHINERGEVLLNIHGEWQQYPSDYLIARHQGGEYYHLDKVNKSYSSAYETYRVKIPGNMSRDEATSEINSGRLELFIAVDTRTQINVYKLFPAVVQTASNTTLLNIAKRDALAPHVRYKAISRNQIEASLYLKVYPDEELNSSKLSGIVVYTPSGIKVIPPSAVTGNKLMMDISDLHYDAERRSYRFLYVIVWKDSNRIGGLDLFAGMTEKSLDFSQFPVTPFPGVRYIQIGYDKTTVGFGNNWYDRPVIGPNNRMGTLGYVTEDGSHAGATQTMDMIHPGTYGYANDEAARNIYPFTPVNGLASFIFHWDNGTELQEHVVWLNKDPHIPGLYSIQPTYDYTNINHEGHVAVNDTAHWFPLPGRLVETASLGTNVDYTDRRTILINEASRLTVTDDFIGDYWEKGRLIALTETIPNNNNKSRQGRSKRINIRSQLDGRPYNYYYGNSFLKTNETFDAHSRNLNATVDYGDEDKLPGVGQDFTTNCGYNNSSRNLSDWTISRVYYDHTKRLRFGQDGTRHSRVNYSGVVRDLTPTGVVPSGYGVATIVNGGTIRSTGRTVPLFYRTPHCAIIEGDIVVDATGSDDMTPLELYRFAENSASVLIMRGRILIKGSSNLNPFIGIKSPTLIINETQWDLNQLFVVMPKPRVRRDYRVIGGILRDGEGVAFIEDTKKRGIPSSISSLRNVTVIDMGKTSLSNNPVFTVAGNIHRAIINEGGYFETTNFDTSNFIDEISRHLTQETIPFGFGGYKSISFPYYSTPKLAGDSDIEYGYPEPNLRKDLLNHNVFVYDFTGKVYYPEERKGRYRKQYRWFYNAGTEAGFIGFIKSTMINDDNRELVNAKRILVSNETRSTGITYRMVNSIDEALRAVTWDKNSSKSVSLYIFG